MLRDESEELGDFDDGRWQVLEPARRRAAADSTPLGGPPEPGAHGDEQTFYDELTGEPLPTSLVRAARQEEVDFMEGWRCWERVGPEVAWKKGGKKPLRTRWVDVNKGDEKNPDVRCRLVAKDIAFQRDDSFFAATPLLGALRMLLSGTPTGRMGRRG